MHFVCESSCSHGQVEQGRHHGTQETIAQAPPQPVVTTKFIKIWHVDWSTLESCRIEENETWKMVRKSMSCSISSILSEHLISPQLVRLRQLVKNPRIDDAHTSVVGPLKLDGIHLQNCLCIQKQLTYIVSYSVHIRNGFLFYKPIDWEICSSIRLENQLQWECCSTQQIALILKLYNCIVWSNGLVKNQNKT